MRSPRGSVLILGGSGYLGRFLIDHFARDPRYNVAYTYHSNPLSIPSLSVYASEHDSGGESGSRWIKGYCVNLETGKGLQECLRDAKPCVICNCAAISQPVLCEKDPKKARAINVPSVLINILLEMTVQERLPLVLHMSTDQVYDGMTRSNWVETDTCEPVNAYGRSKLESEEYIRNQYPNHVILRSSIIFGKELPRLWPKTPNSRPLFTQFVDDVLRAEEPTSFFNDEYRNPIYVKDICKIMHHLASREMDKGNDGSLYLQKTYNMGGPDRLSRVDMANLIADIRGYNKSCIISCSSADVQRPYVSPPDISMDSSKLTNELGIPRTDVTSAMLEVFHEHLSC